MSRIWKLPITLPAGVTVEISQSEIIVKWQKGTLSFPILTGVTLTQKEGAIEVSIWDESNSSQKAFWGTTRAILSNMILGVSEGFKKSLEIVWVGYKFDVKSPKKIELALGFSHKVLVDAPEGVTIENDKDDKNKIHLLSHDKQLLGYFAAYIRGLKKPEPYKGKGIRYSGEHIRRKAGKTAGK